VCRVLRRSERRETPLVAFNTDVHIFIHESIYASSLA